ncbi:conserved exported hypothetical protein [Gammaproteobacteria bacterium]
MNSWRTIRYLILVSLLGFAGIALAVAEGLDDSSSCEEAGETHLWISPFHPKVDAVIKFMAVATDGAISEMALFDRQGQRISLESRRRGGPPWSVSAMLGGLNEGSYRLEALRNGNRIACRWVKVGDPTEQERAFRWNLSTEAFYAAWIEGLFGASPEENLSFPSLAPVLHDPARNFLYNHFGLNEDQTLPATPDCADLPYTLRAYFSWKIGLPVAFRVCSRGSTNAPPHCGPATIKTEFTHGRSSQAGFRSVNGQLANAVHSGSARTGLNDEATDLYPLALRRETLWPGTVYADPYGHVLVLVQWVEQTENQSGRLLAVDAQPDHAVTRKRFWEGTFLFANIASAGPGFKAFRPLIQIGSDQVRALSNGELLEHPGFAPFSLEQDGLTPDDFYARLAGLINPHGLDSRQDYEATLDALVEQVETRVTSVNNGEDYFRKNSGSVISMPSGAAIFETIGPWEDYSTPSRDLRLIIAINVLNGLPEKIMHHPDFFVMNGRSPQEAKSDIEQYHARRIQERKIRYIRTDGSPWELSIAEVLARKSSYEMTYNPNDCAELRWGAQPGTTEYSTCRRHAPEAQHAKMEQYRVWFREARRPTR